MGRIFLIGMAATVVFGASAVAEMKMMTEKDKCAKNVAEARQIMDSDETPDPGVKTRAEAEKLLEVAAHLCDQGNFRYADTVLVTVRGMVASE